jgi:hypothetical protein
MPDPPAWFTYVTAVTGAVGGVLGILAYRRSLALKKIDLRLRLRKELVDVRADVQELPAFLEYAKRSRKNAWAAKGTVRTGAFQVWKEAWERDLAAARDLANEVPPDEEHRRVSARDLESKLVAAYELKDKAKRLREKYQKGLAADDVDREHIWQAMRDRTRGA